jgi:hypothetical protein
LAISSQGQCQILPSPTFPTSSKPQPSHTTLTCCPCCPMRSARPCTSTTS